MNFACLVTRWMWNFWSIISDQWFIFVRLLTVAWQSHKVSWILFNTCSGNGLFHLGGGSKPIDSILVFFSIFFKLSKYLLPVQNHIHIWQGLALLTLSWDKNRDSHSLVNGYPNFYPRIALVAPSPGVTTAELWLHLPNMNVIQRIWQLLLQSQNSLTEELTNWVVITSSPESMLVYCQLNSERHISMTFQ